MRRIPRSCPDSSTGPKTQQATELWYPMTLPSVTTNAKIVRMKDTLGAIRGRMLAGLLAVLGDPTTNMQALRDVRFVMKEGVVYKRP